MNAEVLLKILQVLGAALDVAESTGINIQKLQAIRDKAKAENREISAEELLQLSADAQSAIDAAKGA
jgi:hypothetical protein